MGYKTGPHITPRYYTNKEGGDWIPWTGSRIQVSRLRKLARYNQKRSALVTGEGNFIYKNFNHHGRIIHSIRMPNGAEWDVLNGWRLF